jgi:8-oxo-dGTP pyrophosphatase MutT (NUDIX family)
VSEPTPNSAWQAALRAGADRPPVRPRVPLWAGPARIGSVEADLLARIPLRPGLVARRRDEEGWEVQGDPSEALRELAFALRDAGVAHAWREEQLAVADESGQVLGSIERAVVRPLGITTHAVHLCGFSEDGRHWVQQRSLTKPNDPGLWDTLMGGMIPASDTVMRALERETWEEAGLRLDQLADLAHGGRITTRRPTGESSAGYVVEHITWYRCVIPDGVVPQNQDGEVAQFKLMSRAELSQRLERDEFTTEAALILLEAGI